MALVNEPRHPQALFAGVTAADPEYKAMAALVQAARLLDADGMDSLRAVEWDILVSKKVGVNAPRHMHVLALGCQSVGMAKFTQRLVAVGYGGAQPSQTLDVTDDLPDALRRLVLGELVPWLQERPRRPHLTTHGSMGNHFGASGDCRIRRQRHRPGFPSCAMPTAT